MESVKRRNIIVAVILLAFLFALAIRVLTSFDLNQSAFQYVGLPFFIGLILTWINLFFNEDDWKKRYKNMSVQSLLVFIGASIILFEGFICILFFLPIYFGVIGIAFVTELLIRKYRDNNRNKTFVYLLPVIIFLSAFEGTTPELSFNREMSVSESKVIHASIEEIKHKLTQPMQLQQERSWFLSIFPMPHQVFSETLQEGDVHQVNVDYHRWFVTNTHSGQIRLKLTQVKENYIQTQFVEDTSYFANYMNIKGTEIIFKPIDANTTEVTLNIHFERLLDPVWYFGPLQSYGVSQGAKFLIEHVITPK